MKTKRARRGTALVLCMILVVMLGSLAVALATLSGASVQLADNQRQANGALTAAESGLDVMRYWLDRFIMPKTTLPANYFTTIVTWLQANLPANIVVENDGRIEFVALNSADGSEFSAQLQIATANPEILLVSLTGTNSGMTRTINVAFSVAPYEHPIFNYGMATKGAIHFPQNPTLTGASTNWEADVYIDTAEMIAVDIGGNANFDGNFSIRNSEGQISYAGDLQIGGDHGETAIANHVFTDVPPVDFPSPDTQAFAGFATGPTVDPTTMDLTKGITLTNATIPAGLNPTFAGTVTINGVLWIEPPNVVTFDRNCQLNGVIVGDGTIGSTQDNQINFAGNFATGAYPMGEEFTALQSAIGTSIVAPGFSAAFTGNFSAIDGVVAVSGVTFAGNASADVRGTIINYSDEPTVVDGNISLNFDRAASVTIPAGFDTHRVLAYNPTSYCMAF